MGLMINRKNQYSEVVIRIAGLPYGQHEYNFSVQPASVGLDGNFHDIVSIHAEIEKSSRQILLKTDIITTGVFECDRCLDEFIQPISTSYNLCYVYNEVDGEKISPEELQVISPDTLLLDLADDIRQMVLLSVPLKLLCSEDCKGLCPHCGTNWNHGTCNCKQEEIDPRWQGLKDFLSH